MKGPGNLKTLSFRTCGTSPTKVSTTKLQLGQSGTTNVESGVQCPSCGGGEKDLLISLPSEMLRLGRGKNDYIAL